MRQALQQIASRWLDPQDPLRQEAIASAAPEFCLSPASFELALEWIFSQWTETKIAALMANNSFKGRRYAAQVLAGTTPAMIAQGFLQAAILNIPQVIKIPRQQQYFARLLHQAFREHAVKQASSWELHAEPAAFYARLAEADLVFAYGRDETLATLKKQLAPGVILIEHGHVESAALIFKEAAHHQTLENLAYDMLSYDQRGCLSPRVTFIEHGGFLSPDSCAKVFAQEILPAMAKRFPRGGLFPGEAAEILHQRSLYGFRGQVYAGEDWTVCYDEKLSWPDVALSRFMPVKSFQSVKELMLILEPLKNRLISLGYAGSELKMKSLPLDTSTRQCSLGEMQKQLLIF